MGGGEGGGVMWEEGRGEMCYMGGWEGMEV